MAQDAYLYQDCGQTVATDNQQEHNDTVHATVPTYSPVVPTYSPVLPKYKG